jgi:hypothetical protein
MEKSSVPETAARESRRLSDSAMMHSARVRIPPKSAHACRWARHGDCEFC